MDVFNFLNPETLFPFLPREHKVRAAAPSSSPSYYTDKRRVTFLCLVGGLPQGTFNDVWPRLVVSSR